jgi:hypothetical protein
LFLGDKNSPYYKPGSIEELANHIVRYFRETRTAPTTSQAPLRNWPTILSGISGREEQPLLQARLN